MKWKCDSGSKKDKELYEKQKIHEKFLDCNQPERLNEKTSNGCDSLNTANKKMQ